MILPSICGTDVGSHGVGDVIVVHGPSHILGSGQTGNYFIKPIICLYLCIQNISLSTFLLNKWILPGSRIDGSLAITLASDKEHRWESCNISCWDCNSRRVDQAAFKNCAIWDMRTG
jgi:hypothetical protein